MQGIRSLFKYRGTWPIGRSLVRCSSGISPHRIESVALNCNPHITNTLSEDFIVRCPYEDTAIPEKNFYNHVFQPFGKATALIDGVTGREYSYNEVQEVVVNMASGLVRSGMEKGDVLALVSPNSAEFCTTFFSTLAMGGIVSTCNPQYTAEELAYQFKDSNSKYVATIPALLPTIKEAVSKSGCVEKIIILSDEGGLGEGKKMISYQSLVKDSGLLFPHDLNINTKEDIALLLYSSSATGVPKAVMLTHHNITASVCQLAYPQFVDYSDPSCRSIGILPFYSVYGLSVVLSSGLYQGCTNVILPQFEPKLFLQTVQKYRVTHSSLVPPLVVFLAKHQMVDRYDLSSLKTILNCTDSSTRGGLLDLIQERLGAKVVRQGYGMAELSSVSHCCPCDVFNPFSVGTPVLNTRSKVIDLETGETLGPNHEGEVVVKGPQVMKGYLNDHKATVAVINDGWFHTKDIGYYDENGYFYIVDRLKELIKVKGFQVAPAELEALLLQHPHISDVAVIGVDDERSGELPRAFVIRSSDDLTEQQVEDYVKGRVAEHKQLKGGVKFIKEIPKSPSGRTLRQQLL